MAIDLDAQEELISELRDAAASYRGDYYLDVASEWITEAVEALSAARAEILRLRVENVWR